MVTTPVPTLADVAARAGVSLATASRALHPSNRTVGAELKARVLDAAKQLGYSVNAQAQAVARGASNTVALVVGDIADPYFAAIAAGTVPVAKSNGLVLTITALPFIDHDSRATQESEALAAVRAQRPRAVLFAASRDVAQDWEGFANLDRLVVIGPQAPGLRSIVIDNRGGSVELAVALRDRGYTDIAIVAGPLELVTVAERVDGFRSIFEAADVQSNAFSRDGGYAATAELLASGRRPECIFAVTDVMAIGAMSAIADAGLRPGVDIGVAGFDDIALLRDVTPRLTSVHLQLEDIGARALNLALDDDPADLSIAVRGRVELRESTPSR